MGVEMNLSVAASLALGLAWHCQSEVEQTDGRPTARAAGASGQLLKLCTKLKPWKQVMVVTVCLLASSSLVNLIATACTLGFSSDPSQNWLGHHELGLPRRWLLLLALTLHRADHVEQLAERTLRSAKVVTRLGPSACLCRGFQDPMTCIWPGLWGISRRLAPIFITSLGTGPFMLILFPALLLDELLCDGLARLSSWWAKRADGIPDIVENKLIPLAAVIHGLPMVSRMLVLAMSGYWDYHSSTSVGRLLIVSAFAWTSHNLHVLWVAVQSAFV